MLIFQFALFPVACCFMMGDRTPLSLTSKRMADAATEAMQNCFGFSPREWQQQALAFILKASRKAHNSVGPVPILLCQATGGGKSLVRDTVSAVLVVLVLVVSFLSESNVLIVVGSSITIHY